MLPTDKDDNEDDKFVINFFRGNKKVILDVLDWEITRLVVTRKLKVIVKVCCWTLQSYATMFPIYGALMMILLKRKQHQLSSSENI